MIYNIFKGDAAKSPASVRVGEMYAAMYEDFRWYRCVVKNVLPDDNISVQFIDYGDFTGVLRACMAKLPEKFCKLPPLAISVKLHGMGLVFFFLRK